MDTSWRGLMAAVIAQAAADLKSPDPIKSVDAALFLTGDDFPLWAEAVGMPDLDGIQFLISGRARTVSRSKKTQMINDNILTLFDGLTKDEAREFRSMIIPTLKKIRNEIVEKRQESTSKAETSRGNTDEMQGKNTKRQTVSGEST